MTMEIKRTCNATAKSGERCRGWPNGSGFCPAHRPGHREISALGGHNRSKVVQLQRHLPDRLRPLLDTLAEAIEQVKTGQMKPSQG